MAGIWRKSAAAALFAVGALVLQACGSAPPVPEDKYYRLQAVFASEPMAAPRFDGTVEVERFVADGVTAGRPIVFSEAGKPNQLNEYHYHFWTEPPTIMLRDELVNYLRAANAARQVVTPEMRVRADYALTGKIHRLERVVGDRSSTVMELELAVRRPETGELVLLKTYRHQADAVAAGVAGAVLSLNEALSLIYADFLEDLKAG